MLEIMSMPRVATSFEIMLIVYFFSLMTKELVLLFAKFIDLALRVALEACVNNAFAFAINKSSTKI